MTKWVVGKQTAGGDNAEGEEGNVIMCYNEDKQRALRQNGLRR